MSEEAAEEFSGFDEIIAVKHRKMHSLDAVWIPNNGDYVDVRVDFPAGMYRRNGEAAHLQVASAVAGLMGTDVLQTPINLFPLIDMIYQSAGEGRVVEMSFGTTTSSIKNEKMRRTRASLRDETYHVGGLTALGTPIEPFSLSVAWQRQFSSGRFSHPELSLHSTSRVSGQANPELFDAAITRCMGYDDYDFVRSRIVHYLP